MSTLADALRALLALTDSQERDPHSGAVVGVNDDIAAAEDAAREALAAHDAAVTAGGCTAHGDAVIANGDVVARGCAGSVTLACMRAARIAACVNACTGIADPGALVPALRQACTVLRAIANSPQGSLDRDAVRGELNVALRALDGVPACSVGSTVRESDND